jgi:hypothetical protein
MPKPDGRQRPLGIAAVEDKIVQRAVVEVLNAIYEEDFSGSATDSARGVADMMRRGTSPWAEGSRTLWQSRSRTQAGGGRITGAPRCPSVERARNPPDTGRRKLPKYNENCVFAAELPE